MIYVKLKFHMNTSFKRKGTFYVNNDYNVKRLYLEKNICITKIEGYFTHSKYFKNSNHMTFLSPSIPTEDEINRFKLAEKLYSL